MRQAVAAEELSDPGFWDKQLMAEHRGAPQQQDKVLSEEAIRVIRVLMLQVTEVPAEEEHHKPVLQEELTKQEPTAEREEFLEADLPYQ